MQRDIPLKFIFSARISGEKDRLDYSVKFSINPSSKNLQPIQFPLFSANAR